MLFVTVLKFVLRDCGVTGSDVVSLLSVSLACETSLGCIDGVLDAVCVTG